jgi:hypothetical protein
MVQDWLTQQLLSAEELTIHMHAGHTVSVIDMQKIFAQNSNTHLSISDQNMLMIHNFIEEVYGTQKASL